MNSNNYTGPYWSDGKLQSSVEFGRTPPGSALDAESRLHDSAYAHYNDTQHRIAADYIYNEHLANLGSTEAIVGETVFIGNQVLRAGAGIVSDFLSYGPLGLVTGAVKDAYYVADYALNHNKYEKEVLDYYKTDPGWIRSMDESNNQVSEGKKDVVKKTGVSNLVPTKPPLIRHSNREEFSSPALLYYNPYSTMKRRKRRRRL